MVVAREVPEATGTGGRASLVTRSSGVRILVAVALACVLVGVAVVVLGPFRWSRDRSDATRRRQEAATLATCLQFRSLAEGEAAGAIPPAEMRTRVGQLYLAADGARADVRAAVSDLQDGVVASGGASLLPAADSLRAACDRP